MKDSKIRILFITRKFPPSVGGMERFAFDLYKSINKKENVTLIKWSGKNRYLALFMLPVFFMRSFWLLITEKIDIIHMQDGVLSVLGVILKFIFRKPLVVVIHGLDITFENKPYQFIVPRSLKYADQIICISNAAKDEVIKRGIDAQKVKFIPLGITDDLFINDKGSAKARTLDELKIKDNNTQIILSTGRLVKRKGVNWFVNKVMPDLIKTTNVLFVISGDGEERLAIEQSIIRNNLSSDVYLLGRTSDNVLKDLYNGSDIFVMPNITVKGDMEGFGRVLLEAAVCELPVVASDIEGIKDAIISGKNGILVKEQNKAAFIKEIRRMLRNKKMTKEFAKKARIYTLTNYSWSNIADSYIEIYKTLSG